MHYAFGLPLGTTSPVLSDGPKRHPDTGSLASSSDEDAKRSLPDLTKATLLPQRTCPFKDERIKATHWLDFDGKRIYTCCDPCLDMLKNESTTRSAKLSQSQT